MDKYIYTVSGVPQVDSYNNFRPQIIYNKFRPRTCELRPKIQVIAKDEKED